MILMFLAITAVADLWANDKPAPLPIQPVVEAEEDVYNFAPANNGAGPMWCSGSTCLVRIGDDVFASGLETLKDAKPLNNCRWTLYQRTAAGWQLVQADPAGRTREPCPLVTLGGGNLLLSANPTLVADRNAYNGPAHPEILRFSAKDPKAPFETILPVWDGQPQFTEHSYRSFATDSSSGGLILFQNIGYTHTEWAFRDGDGRWAARQARLAVGCRVRQAPAHPCLLPGRGRSRPGGPLLRRQRHRRTVQEVAGTQAEADGPEVGL